MENYLLRICHRLSQSILFEVIDARSGPATKGHNSRQVWQILSYRSQFWYADLLLKVLQHIVCNLENLANGFTRYLKLGVKKYKKNQR